MDQTNPNSIQKNELHLLSQVMSLYPDYWNTSSKHLLLMDMDNDSITTGALDVFSRLSRVRDGLVFPLIRILLDERDERKASKEAAFMKEQQLQTSLLAAQKESAEIVNRLEEEIDQSMQQNMLIEILLNDMERMARTSEQQRKEIQQLQHTLFIKELQIRAAKSEQQNLLNGVKTREDSQQGINSSETDLQVESSFGSPWDASSTSMAEETPSVYCGSSVSRSVSSRSTLTSISTGEEEEETESVQRLSLQKQDFLPKQDDRMTIKGERTGILLLVLVDLWQEGLSSVQIVQESGLSSVPLALVNFWIRFAIRMANHMTEFVHKC